MRLVLILLIIIALSWYADCSKCFHNCQENIQNCVHVLMYSSHNTCVKNNEKIWECPSIATAFEEISLNDTCFVVFGSQQLSTLNIQTHIKNFTITGNSSASEITCLEGAGFSFKNSQSLEFSNLKLAKCGTIVDTLVFNSKTEQTLSATISSALYFDHTNTINFNNVHVMWSNGYGIFMSDCIGDIAFTNTRLSENELKPLSTYTSGGGIVFLHLAMDIELTANIEFKNVTIEYMKSHTDDKTIKPFGYGGAVSLLFLGNSTKNSVDLIQSSMNGNTAVAGGGIYLEHGANSSDNHVLMSAVEINDNKANISGGGILYYSKKNLASNKNTFNLNCSKIQRNIVDNGVGGGFANRNNSWSERQANIKISGCSFTDNRAKLGSALYLQDTSVEFNVGLPGCYKNGVLVHSNSPQINDQIGFAALYAYKTRLNVIGKLDIRNNKRTGLGLDYSFLYIHGSVFLEDNQGINGGGIALYEKSIIYIGDNSTLYLRKNMANKGGGIYIKLSAPPLFAWESLELQVYDCYFQSINKTNLYPGHVTFEGNRATEEDGDDVFTTSLQPCKRKFPSDKHSFVSWKNFHGLSNTSVSTDPVRIITNDSDWKIIYPGRLNSMMVDVKDELNNSISAVLTMQVINHDEKTNVRIKQFEQFVVTNGTLQNFILIGPRYKTFDIILTTYTGKAEQKKIANLKLRRCPFGYVFNRNDGSDECVCENLKNAARGITQCKGEDIYVLANMWAKYNQTSQATDNETLQKCPQGYCRKCNKPGENGVECKYEHNNQCAPGRLQSSILCSQCKPGFSVLYGGERCVENAHTPWNFVGVLFGIFGGTFVVVYLCLFFDVGVYDNYLNSIFFFYQVVQLFFTTTQTFDPVMDLISSGINLNGFKIRSSGSFMIDGFSDLWKPFINLLFVVFAIIFLYIISHVGVVCCDIACFKWNLKRSGRLSREYKFRGLVLIVVWAYGLLTDITFRIIQPITIDHQTYAYIDAQYPYVKSLHAVVFYLFLIPLITVILFPIVLVFNDKMKGCCCIQKIAVALDMFKVCFKKDCISQFFSAYYFFWRLILFGIRTFLLSPNQVVLTVLTCLSVVMLIVFVLLNPYKEEVDYENEKATDKDDREDSEMIRKLREEKDNNEVIADLRPYHLNWFDTVVITTLCAIGVISNGRQKLSIHDPMDTTFQNMIIFLTWVPISLLIIMRLYRTGYYCWRKFKSKSYVSLK